jgi:hypothetical protein
MKHIVKYTESERGWGGEVWYRDLGNKEVALNEVKEVNADLPTKTPDYYIQAEYIGEMDEIPKGYRF